MPRVDIFNKLPDDWYSNASEAVKWKGRFACCNDLYELVEPLNEKSTVKGGKQADKAIAYLADWLDTEQHVFTRIKILQILTKLIPAMSIDSFTKKHRKIATGCMKQYSEKKVCNLVNPVLYSLWIKEGSFSNWSESIVKTMTSPNPIPKAFLYTFITDCAIANPAKAKEEIKKVLKDHGSDIMSILVKDTDHRNVDCKKGSIKFLCIIGIFMAKEKDKRYIKIINSLCEQNAKVKSNMDLMKPDIRSNMKQNAIFLRKKSKKSDTGDGNAKVNKKMVMNVDDEKLQINLQQSMSSNASMSGSGVSSAELNQMKNEIAQLSQELQMMKVDMSAVMKYVEEQKENIYKRRMVLGIGASVHDLFDNFLVGVIGMPQYLERFKTAGANDIRMVEHFDVPFLKETIGVQNKLEGKLLVKFIGKFNEETMKFRDWLRRQKVLKAYTNTFECKGIITWGILMDYCESINAVQQAFRIKNKAHAKFLYAQVERYRNGELSDDDEDESSSSEEETDIEDEDD